jgi:peptidyl-prolyl cis-trans isomerase SurA
MKRNIEKMLVGAVVLSMKLILCCVPFFVFSGEQNSILATIDGEAVTLLDVLSETKEKEARLLAVYPRELARHQVEDLRKEVVENIIAEKVIFDEFKAKEYKLPPQIIEEMLDELALEMAEGDRAKLAEMAEKYGMTMEKLRRKAEQRAAVAIMLNEFCFRELAVSPKEIQDYIEIRKKNISQLQEVELYAILIKKTGPDDKSKDELLEKIRKDIQSDNKDIFMTLAKLYSDAPNAMSGGYLGWAEKNKLRPEFSSVIAELSPGKSTGSVETGEGAYFLFLSANRDGKEKNFSDDPSSADAAIKGKILSEKKTKKKNEFINKLRENAVIRYYF